MRPTESRHPALTLETLQDIKSAMNEWRPEIDRIVVGCPLFRPDRVRKWREGRIVFIGAEAFAEITRACEEPGHRIAPDAAISLGGIALEPWGSRADHAALADRASRDLAQ